MTHKRDFTMKVDDALLKKYGENEARSITVAGRVKAVHVSLCIGKHLKTIQHTALRASTWAPGPAALPQEFEWLLDNRYLLEREARDAILVLRKAGPLPAVKYEMLPAAYRLAVQFAHAGQNEVTVERLAIFLQGIQSVRPFSERELFLFVPLVKAALIESVAGLCREMNDMLDAYRKDDDNPYAAELAVRRSLEEGSAPPESVGIMAQEAAHTHNRLSKLIGQAVTSLRLLSSADFSELLQSASAVENLLKQDPADVYSDMDEASRAFYRHELSRLAERRHISEADAAETVLLLARKGADARRRHVGYYILQQPLGKRKGAWIGRVYFLSQLGLTAALSVAAYLFSHSLWMTLLLLLPLSDVAKNITDFATVRLTRPRHIPRLELMQGLPPHGATLCVISAILTDTTKAKQYVKLLEEYRIANRDAGNRLAFGLLADLPDAPVKRRSGDKIVLEAAQKAVFELNRRYGGGFYFFSRDRQLNTNDKIYMAWERKRGALLELMRMLRGLPTGLHAATGDLSALKKVRYLITLDADTRLTAGSAREMVGAMMHPLTVATVDSERKVVTEGHALLQPRMAVDLESAGRTVFARIYAGQGGLDPYGGASSDVYQDVFDRGIFNGKGIFDVDAALTCLDSRFPENRVLSHDLLEGCYLRAGLLGDVELADGYPSKVSAWLERLHRWTRGDWQIAGWLCPRVKNGQGRREKNPLDALSKWKIFDNLRRSLSPVCLLVALTLGFAAATLPLVTVTAIAIACVGSNLLLSAAELAVRGGRRARYHSTIITGITGTTLQCALQLLFLPSLTYVTIHATVVAIYRMLFSHKKLLKWVTSAETERISGANVWFYTRKMFPTVVWGVFCAMLSPVGWVAGVLWVAAPVVAFQISRVRRSVQSLNGEDRAFLMRQAALIWQYFEDFLTPEDHYLPPDNWQEQPAAGIAHRTSPTNIGLALLCALAALDLQMAGSEHVLRIIDKLLTTMERLPKWNGHIYNWYDTCTLEPLKPRYVSTVDSGNLACCLIALREGLGEMSDAAAEDLAERADRLSRNMDFTQLYDPKRRLFFIGYDLELGASPESYYDLLASEARQTSFLTVARGVVERRHWRRLGRALVTDDRYNGMASWTGTMFEYLMPHLLMPCYENSLLYESARFCVYCHRKRGAESGVPWGISESCFYAFDNALNYQYKAHGVPRLAFKRGLGKESVVAPYAAYLALMVSPQNAVKNLRRMRDMGMEGRYGLFEAADFTPTRQTGKDGVEMVRCFMSHHIGMSLLAIVNTLKDNVMQKRFMRDPEMGAFAELLQEKVPVGAVSVRPFGREVPEKPARQPLEGYHRSGEAMMSDRPVCHVLSNNSYVVFCDDAGLTASFCGDLSLTRFVPRLDDRACGLIMAVDDGQTCVGATPMPWAQKQVKFRYEFDATEACWTFESEGLSGALTLRVPDNEMGELRVMELKNTSAVTKKLTLACYFEPVLARRRDFEAHPAFSKLFLETDIQGQTVTVRRKSRVSKGDSFLAFTCDHPQVSYDTSREKALGRGGMDRLQAAVRKPSMGTKGGVIDPCVLARVPIELPPGTSVQVKFAMTVAAEKVDAMSSAVRTVSMPDTVDKPGRLENLLRLLGLSNHEATGAFDMLRDIVFGTGYRDRQAIRVNTLGQSDLWKFGVSGDAPILLFDAHDKKLTERLTRLIRQHRLLTLLSISCDLVIFTHDGADYLQPMRGLVVETLKAIGADNMAGARGGVHVVDVSSCAPEEECLFRALARWTYREPDPARDEEEVRHSVVPKVRADVLPEFDGTVGLPETRYLTDGAFQFVMEDSLPPCAWSHVLANPSFGALMTDAGTGYMWRFNARENKMTPWSNDPLAMRGGENIAVSAGGKTVSLFAAADGMKTSVTYGFGYAQWEKSLGNLTITTTAFVPPTRMARVLMVEVNGAMEACLHYQSEVLMGVDHNAKHQVAWEQTPDGFVRARNTYNAAYHPQTFVFAGSETWDDVSTDRSEVSMTMTFRSATKGLRAIVICGCGNNEQGVSLLSQLTDWDCAENMFKETKDWWRARVCPLRVDTPDTHLNAYLNGWALYQVEASRVFARTSLYQCGGAYGFRDQLQDVCALLYGDPQVARRQILRACVHQYEEGDVQHWWHGASRTNGLGDRGVRTTCSDDLLWLPYVVCEYLEKTGDSELLFHRLPYLSSPELAKGEEDRFETPRYSQDRETVLSHCIRAIEKVKNRGVGAHGLLLMGGGDWNDGFNLVGAEGRGESTWLTWFAAHVLERFSHVCDDHGETETAEKLRRLSSAWTEASHSAWDGAWFLRGYFDNGATLGSHRDEECQIDSIAQSFSALAPGHPEYSVALTREKRVSEAINSALSKLVDREHRVVRLFTPSFVNSPQNPGYIKGYLSGVRENGGQYTHAAVWLALGCLLSGKVEEGCEIMNLLLPSTHDPSVYRAEPFVLAADVYYNELHMGRGGWSSYTGAAAWYYRVAVAHILGIQWRDGALSALTPKLPSGWPSYTLSVAGTSFDVPREGLTVTPVACEQKEFHIHENV